MNSRKNKEMLEILCREYIEVNNMIFDENVQKSLSLYEFDKCIKDADSYARLIALYCCRSYGYDRSSEGLFFKL